MKNPPILVSVLGFFAALAGFGFLFFGLRVIGFDWFGVLGELPQFEHVGLWARLFVQIMAGFAIFEAVLAFFQFPGSGIGFAMAIMPALILWYLSTDDVKAAFAEDLPAI